ncbi:40S ribosomal protein S15 [Komagataella phaffii CBS 7435]|uniref:BA75_04046T0 n=2 Tax=Komagataella TaxID=460517 RepID=A0A1B2JG85_PICPA|nr:BA75_04046T0 [Komagataella pastoris]AOA61708.1 GQ67_01659T0 [Komagataella phaffii]AOA66026.1 GQ68_01675T0 [Komagataella phaffii GS115]KAI0464291.1 ribosomal protein S15 [Komagataella kurtzmanii]CAH2447169.1 40S ribosomal protein S15 [Komagataella phaffii CBS 7435]
MSEVNAERKKRILKSYSYRGIDLEALLKLSNEEFGKLCTSSVRRRFSRGLGDREERFLKKLRVVKLATPPNEKPAVVKTHLRKMIVVPEMIGSVVGVYNGKIFNTVEIKPEMLGHYLGEFSMTYTPVRHGKAGVGNAARFAALK